MVTISSGSVQNVSVAMQANLNINISTHEVLSLQVGPRVNNNG